MPRHGPPTITPGLLYYEAPKAIDWLCDTFGFTRRLVVPGENDTIVHAHLTFGSGGVMLGSAETNRRTTLHQNPKDMGGLCSHGISVYVEDIEAFYGRVLTMGAEILMPLEDMPYGGKAFSCRDIGGYVWHFGSYDPWAESEAN